MTLGAIFFVDPTRPGELAVSLKLVAPIIFTMGSMILIAVYLLLKARRKKKTTGVEGLVGEHGEAMEDIAPSFSRKVFVSGEIWTAESLEPIKKGDKIVVEEVKGISLIKVKKLT